MNNKDLSNKIAELTDESLSSITQKLDIMDVDEIINMTAAVDDQDADTVMKLLDQAEQDEQDEDESQPVQKSTIADINRQGHRDLEQKKDLGQVWRMIAQHTQSDWNLMWPGIHEPLLQALYQEATDETTDDVGATQAQEIYDHARSFVTEHVVIWNNQLCEVKVHQGPHNTVGIWYEDHVIMVPRGETQPVMEHVLGFTGMPHIGRMLQLAGVDNATPMTMNPPSPAYPQDTVSQIRMHMQELEQLLHKSSVLEAGSVSMSEQDQEEAQLHARAISRKAHTLAQSLRGGGHEDP